MTRCTFSQEALESVKCSSSIPTKPLVRVFLLAQPACNGLGHRLTRSDSLQGTVHKSSGVRSGMEPREETVSVCALVDEVTTLRDCSLVNRYGMMIAIITGEGYGGVELRVCELSSALTFCIRLPEDLRRESMREAVTGVLHIAAV